MSSPLPQSLSDNIAAIQKAYGPAIQQQSVFERHPIAGILAGLLTAGPLGALAVHSGAKRTGLERRTKAYQNEQDAIDKAYERQVTEHSITGPLAAWNERQKDIAKNNPNYTPPDWQTLNPNDPSGFSRPETPYIPEEAQKELYKSRLAPSDLNAEMSLMPQVARSGINVMNNKEGAQGTLQGGVAFQSSDLPSAIGNPETLLNNVGETFRSGLSQGTDKYKFDGEAPKREAETGKLIEEAKKAAADGNEAKARALLIKAQTTTEQQRPALIRAQTGQASRSGGSAGRAPSLLESMSPEQRQSYIEKQTGGGPLFPGEAIQLYQLEQAAGGTNWQGQSTDAAQRAAAILNHVRQGGGPMTSRPGSSVGPSGKAQFMGR